MASLFRDFTHNTLLGKPLPPFPSSSTKEARHAPAPMEERPSTGKTATSTSESGADSSKKKTSPLSSLEPFGRLRDPSCWWLPPVLLVTLLALFLAACGGIALSGLVFSGTVEAQDPCLSQSFVLFAVSTAEVFIAESKNHSQKPPLLSP